MIEYYKDFSLEPLFYVNEYGLVCQEEWKDIAEIKNIYQSSNLGRIKSLDRFTISKKGVKRFFKGIVLKQTIGDRGYLQIGLCKKGKPYTIQTHLVIAECFFNHKPNSEINLVVDHKRNKYRKNNSIFNLQVITGRENVTKDSKSKHTSYKGISPTKSGKWTAYIYIGNKKKSFCIGTFDTEEQAGNEYIKAVKNWEENKEVPKDHVKSSEYSGVSWAKSKNKWRATIYIEKELIHIGYYDEESTAHQKYLESVSNWELKNQKPLKNFSSQHKGVCFDKQSGKWKVRKTINGKVKTLGLFKTEFEAYMKTLE